MQGERNNSLQAFSLLVLFLLGEQLILRPDPAAGRDSWLALLCAIGTAAALTAPVIWLLYRSKGTNLYDVLLLRLGHRLGAVAVLSVAAAAFCCGVFSLRSYSWYLQQFSSPTASPLPFLLGLVLLALYALRRGTDTLLRCAPLFLCCIVLLLVFSVLLALPQLQPQRLLPFWQSGEQGFERSFGFYLAALLGGLLPGMVILGEHGRCSRPYSVFLLGIAAAGGVVLLSLLRDLMVLGLPLWEASTFPSHTVMAIISSERFSIRIDGIADAVWMLAGFVRITLCLYTAALGVVSVRGKRSRLPYAIWPLAVGMAAAAYLCCGSTAELLRYDPAAMAIPLLPLLCLLPLAVLILFDRRIGR